MSGLPILAVFGGAGCGALLRWVLGGWLNPVFPTVPLGTLAANLIGGLLVGVASAFFTHHTALPHSSVSAGTCHRSRRAAARWRSRSSPTQTAARRPPSAW